MSPIQLTAEEGHSTSVTGVETPAQAVFVEICRITFGWNWGNEGTKKGCKSSSQMQEGAMDTSSPTNAVLQACLKTSSPYFSKAASCQLDGKN